MLRIFAISLLLISFQLSFAQLSKGYQEFLVNSSRDTVLYGEQGTEIRVPAFAFTDSSGTVFQDAPITILLKEVYDQADMIMEGVSTKSEEGILVSDGMVEVRGKLGEMGVLINPERPIVVRIASLSGELNMRLYTSPDSLEGSSWNLEEGRLKVDTCQGYRKVYIYEEKKFTKAEFLAKRRKAKKDYKISRKQRTFYFSDTENIFGGSSGKYFEYWRGKDGYYRIGVICDSMYECDPNAALNYSYSLFEFGWCNIDKLWRGKRNLKSLKVVSEDKDLIVCIYFPNVKTTLFGSVINGGYRFNYIPDVEPCVLVAYKLDGLHAVFATIKERRFFKPVITLKELKSIPKGTFERKIRSLQKQ